MKRIIAGFLVTIAISGCQTNPHPTQAHFERDRISQQLSTSLAESQICLDKAKENETVRRYFAEIMYYNDESANKHSLITNPLLPTQDQIEVIKGALPHLTKCRSSAVDGTIGTPYQVAILKLFNAMDAIYIKLLKTEISIGAANEGKSRAIAEHKMDWATATTEVNNRINNMYNTEMEGRRQAAAAMMPYLLQQHQNYQNQQQLMYQQQLQSILNSRPAITPPSRTNCTRYGNQIDCVTR